MRKFAAIVVVSAIFAGVPFACDTEDTPGYCDNVSRHCTDPSRPYCDTIAKTCRPAPDGFMPPDLDMGDMAKCTTSATCQDDQPICGNGSCRACMTGDDSECAVHNSAIPRCGSSGTCVACRTDTQAADCRGTTPICGSDNTCRKCQSNSECPSLGTWPEGDATIGICKDDGSCATTAEVAFVDNRGSVTTCAAAHATAAGSVSDPFCDVQTAVIPTAQPKQPFALVRGYGSTMTPAPYGALTISNRNIIIVGPGKTASPPATIVGTFTTDGVVVSGTSAVRLIGLEITGATGTHNGASCGSGTTLEIKNSNIHGNGGAGVSATDCTLSVDASYIGPSNNGGGIVVGGATMYSITNDFVFGNGSGVPGVSLAGLTSAGGGVIAFNTVAGNGGAGSFEGGINCPPGGSPRLIQNSIVAGNSQNAGTQFNGKCQLQNVVTGTDAFAGATQLVPTFQSATNYHLKANDVANQACCVDKIASPGNPNSDHDVDDAHRPQGTTGKWTIGGNELAQ